jgi:putative ABC transport system permease protein
MERLFMGYFKRAVFSNIHHKQRFLLMFAIVLIASVLLLISYQIRLTSSKAVEQIRKNIGASVTVYLANGRLESRDESSYFSYDIAEEMAALPEVKESKYLSMVNVFGKNVHGAKMGIIPVTEIHWGDLQVVGLTDLQSFWNFKQGLDHLVKGRSLTAGDSEMPYAVVSQTVMGMNNLTIGDTISVSSFFDESRSVELEIIGVHSGDDWTSLPEYHSNINFIYTPLKIATDLNGINGIMEAEYILKDPIELESFLSQARFISDKYQIDLKFVENNLDFLLASTALNSLINTCGAIFITVLILACIILSLLVIYLMNDRLFEIGILLSLGEDRYKIVFQMILEILMPALLAINAGVLISSYLIPVIGKAVETSMQINAPLTSVNILYLFLLINCCGILLVIVASVIPFITIKKYSPKEILQRFK